MTRHQLSLDGIHAIFFDLDGTLRHSRPSYDELLLDIAGQRGIECSKAQRLRVLRWGHHYWAQSPQLLQDVQTFDRDRDGLLINYVRRYFIVLGLQPAQAAELAPEFYDRLTAARMESDWVPPDVPEALAKLQKAGYILAVVSNRENPLTETLDRLGLGAFFDFTLVAGQVNSWKPDAELFELAVAQAGTTPEHVIYVGDNYFTDVVGAQRAGLRPVLLDPEGVFPEAECPVIQTMSELTHLLADKSGLEPEATAE